MTYIPLKVELCNVYGSDEALEAMRLPKQSKGDSILQGQVGSKDAKLAQSLILAGDDHAKAMRGILAYVRVHMQVGFMVEFETYTMGVTILSTSSSMHGELRGLAGPELAEQKQADLPEKIYIRMAFFSYQVLRRMYRARRGHRHPDWQIWRDFIETLPNFDKLIMPEGKL